ncbi:MAG: CotH kinase family protein [Bacilli bacterium]|nr:CotH kinase family protein [Bacilli bacterium]
MIPYGCTVEYENNTLSQIGSVEAKAKIYNEGHVLLKTLTANLSIVANTGFSNIRILTEDGAPIVNKTDYVNMSLSTDNCSDDWKLNSVSGGIRYRGNSTYQSGVSKKAYRLKFDKKQAMLGLNGGMKAKSWVLLADFFDQSMFRNNVAFTFGNSLFNYSNNYCTDFQHVNVYLNNDYLGVFTLAEQQQANANRVDVLEPEEDKNGVQNTDEKVGYLLEVEGMGQADSGDVTFRTGDGTGGGNQWGGWGGFGGGGEQINGVGVEDKEYNIKTDTFGDKQLPYIKKYLSNAFKIFKDTIKSKSLKVLDENHEIVQSPYDNMYDSLNSFMDVESLMKTYLVQEIMKNYDVGWASFYLFVDFSEGSKYPRLTFGAPWDFDWSSANPNRDTIIDPLGNYNDNGRQPPFSNPWLYLLSQTDFFQRDFAKYWSVFNKSGTYQRAKEYVSYETSAFASEFANNYATCGNLHGSQSCKMYTRFDVVETFSSHADAVKVLTDWLDLRIDYLNSTWLK